MLGELVPQLAVLLPQIIDLFRQQVAVGDRRSAQRAIRELDLARLFFDNLNLARQVSAGVCRHTAVDARKRDADIEMKRPRENVWICFHTRNEKMEQQKHQNAACDECQVQKFKNREPR